MGFLFICEWDISLREDNNKILSENLFDIQKAKQRISFSGGTKFRNGDIIMAALTFFRAVDIF